MPKGKKYRSVDLFAGIGGIRLGFKDAFGDEIETVFVCEWDANAQKTYRANFRDDFEIQGDITEIDEKSIPAFDICLAGFPCQAFSLAGKKQGFRDNCKGMSRGTLFFDVARICEYRKPKAVFCENVKGLYAHDRGRTLDIIVNTLKEIGYRVFVEVLNSKDFGVPQNRERLYIAAFREDLDSSGFRFPSPREEKKRLGDVLEAEAVPAKYYLSARYLESLKRHKARHAERGNGFGYEIRGADDIAGAIVCGGMGRERNLIVDKRLSRSTTGQAAATMNRENVRKLTPREWARLQGFPEDYRLAVADTHLYKQFGNSVTVPVVRAIAEEIKKTLDCNV
ncbi:MAG: DNA cytosine methyltransferase [Clostridiales Family XIII bacterium]|jgi:DNA (cytosine-5)-methyltransferase 1|nr:DNA cytosine methyltransferase [Clostridiales Family XIII bacterium]